MAEVELPAAGWAYDYTAVEAPRRGQPVLRPVVPLNFSQATNETIVALVDSGSEHTLAAHWWADELGIDLSASQDRIQLGIGGRELRLLRGHNGDDFISWHTDVGFVEPWDAQFYLILGQVGFFDQFTVTMNRRLLTVKVTDGQSVRARLGRTSNLPCQAPGICAAHLRASSTSVHQKVRTLKSLGVLERDAGQEFQVYDGQAALDHRFANGTEPDPADVARLSPLGPTGTLHKIERDLEPCLGKGWLRT